MSKTYFAGIDAIPFEGADSSNPLAFKHYDKDRVVLGKRLEEHLRFAVCYWHNFVWAGSDIFGADAFERPWHVPTDPMEQANAKLEAAFEFMSKLGAPYWCFHDYDIAPEAATMKESRRNLSVMLEKAQQKMDETGVKLLWGTANLFSHPRYIAGAATNPNPEIFAYAASQVQQVLQATHDLGGENYVLWGGREGYENLLNTDLGKEADQMARFLEMVVEFKHQIGFKGTILIEPKPQEPTKHQYDYDTATVFGFLQRYGLEKEIKVNIEVNHATLAGHSFHHEIATAASLGILGSVDANRGDYQNGWDTDQYPNSVDELVPACLEIIRAGGFATGGFNFDTKLRRQSIDEIDLFHGHIGGMDTIALAYILAAELHEDGFLSEFKEKRYGDWSDQFGQDILAKKVTLQEVADWAIENEINPKGVSGRQEMLENYINGKIHRR